MRALKPHSGLHYCDMAGTVRGCLHVMYEAVGSHVRYPPCRNNAGQSAVLMLALDGLLIFSYNRLWLWSKTQLFKMH